MLQQHESSVRYENMSAVHAGTKKWNKIIKTHSVHPNTGANDSAHASTDSLKVV